MMRRALPSLLMLLVTVNAVVGSRSRGGVDAGNAGPAVVRQREYPNPKHREQQRRLPTSRQRRAMNDEGGGGSRREKGRRFGMSMSSSTASPDDDEREICSCSPTTITFELDLCRTCDDDTISDNAGLDGSFCFTETNVSLPGGDPLVEADAEEEGGSSSTTDDEEVRRLRDDEACEDRKYYAKKIDGRTRCANADTDDAALDDSDMFDSSEECCADTFEDVTNCVIVDVCLSDVPTESPSIEDEDGTSSSSSGSGTTTLAPTPTVSREAATYSPTFGSTTESSSGSTDGTNDGDGTPTAATGCNDDDDPIAEIISVQFLEFDTSGDLNVINQDNTYLTNVSLTTGDTISYTSISSYLDTSSPLSYDSYGTNNSPPGGASLILYGKTASGSIVRNRFFWTYSLSCTDDNIPLVVGDGIGWVTVSEISNAWPVFCPALPSNTPTIAPGLTTAPTEVFPTSMPTPTVTGESTPDGGTNIDDIMCSFCNPDGVEFPDLILPTDDGTTCTIASEYAATLLANDVMCPTVLMAEALCCPNNSGGEGTDDEPRPEPCEGNIVDVAMENEDFTTLVEAVTAAGLVDELSGEGPFTVFAPTNDAFDAIPTELLNLLLLPENIEKLQGIILYHVLSGSYPSSDLTSGDRLTLPTINGESVTISVNNDDGVMVNDANVIQTDIIACNGIIHVIDSVLLPPGDDGSLGPDIGDDDEMMSMPRSKAAMEDWSQAEKEYFLQNFAL